MNDSNRLIKEDINKELAQLCLEKADIDKALSGKGEAEHFRILAKAFPNIIDAERCSFFIHDSFNEKAWLQAGTDMEYRGIVVSITDSVVGHVIESGEYVIDNDLGKKSGAHNLISLQTGFTIRNVLCVPVKGHHSEVNIGAIQVLNKHDDKDFIAEDLTLLQGMATSLADKMETLFLLQEKQRRSEILNMNIVILNKKLKLLEHQ